MKNNILILCCCFAVHFSIGQTAANLYKKGDSLYKVKDYKNSAIAYAEGINQEGKAASVGKYWTCACSWSLAGVSDSAFYNLDIIAGSDKLTINDARDIENDNDFIPVKTDKRWQPIIDSMYSKALSRIKKLSDDVRAGARINPVVDKYNIAIAWAISKNTDSAFSYLNKIVNTNYNRFIAYDLLIGEKAFKSLRNDPRWLPLMDEVKKNKLPFTCAHTTHPPGIPIMFTIDPASKFLKNDGKGSYRDNKNKIFSQSNVAYNLLVSGVNELEQSGNWKDSSSRFLILDLNSPVKNSGAVKEVKKSFNFSASSPHLPFSPPRFSISVFALES